MTRGALLFAAGLAASACAASQRIALEDSAAAPRTRAERTAYLETSRYSDVTVFLDSISGRPELTLGKIGTSHEGRSIPYVVASRPRVSTAQEAVASGKPIVYVQANIHGGEVEGKEALLALLRNLTATARGNVLDSIVLIAVPIYNADGNEKFGPQEVSRAFQNGPAIVGQRANGQGLDLNRDYIKAEAPETRASLAMFNTWQPDVFVDLHTTNGSYHGYALTYAPPLNPASRTAAYTRDSLLPVLRERMRTRHQYETFDYGNFVSDDTLSRGWATFDHRARFGTNYYGLRGGIAILSEAYSHDPFPRRVASTYAFIREILSLVAERAEPIVRLTRLRTANGHGVGFASEDSIPIAAELAVAPDSTGVIVEAVEVTSDSAVTEPGMPRGRRRTGRFTRVRMPVYDRFRPTAWAASRAGYVMPAADSAAVRVLRNHGVAVERVTRPWVTSAESFRVDSVFTSARVFQGHREVRVAGSWVRSSRTIPAGSFIVPVSQPLHQLVVYLLEPESDDGLVTWNYFKRTLREGGTHSVLKLVESPPPAARSR